MPKKAFNQLFPQANPDALDLLDKMLAFDPSSRISVEEALEHSYLHIWHDASDEPACPTTFDFGFEVVEEIADMRNLILDEVMRFRLTVRTVPGQAGAIAHGQQVVPGQVPMPQGQEQWTKEDPRPQEYGAQQNLLEQDLQQF